MRTYFQEVNQEVTLADLCTIGTFTCPVLVEKIKTEEIFDFLVKEKFITFSKDHWIPSKDEIRGKTYSKYHNSWNHTTNS